MLRHARSVLVVSLLSAAAAVTPATVGPAAADETPAVVSRAADSRLDGPTSARGESVELQQFKTAKILFSRVCPNCEDGQEVPTTQGQPTAIAGIRVKARSYKVLGEASGRYDFYYVEARATIGNRKGDQDFGWANFDLQSTGRAKVLGTEHTLGKSVQNTDSCKDYPISISGGFGPFGAGTTVGDVSFCHKGSKVTLQNASNGKRYHATGVTGIRSLFMARYVRVKDGSRRPTFRISFGTNSDRRYCQSQGYNGYHCYVGHGWNYKRINIGTTPQRPA